MESSPSGGREPRKRAPEFTDPYFIKPSKSPTKIRVRRTHSRLYCCSLASFRRVIASSLLWVKLLHEQFEITCYTFVPMPRSQYYTWVLQQALRTAQSAILNWKQCYRNSFVNIWLRSEVQLEAEVLFVLRLSCSQVLSNELPHKYLWKEFSTDERSDPLAPFLLTLFKRYSLGPSP